MIVYLVVSDYKGVETHTEGVYSSQKKAEEAIVGRTDCDIYPYHMDGKLGDSAALYFVSCLETGRFIVSPIDTTLIEGYLLHVPKIEKLSSGESVAHVAVRAISSKDAKDVAVALFQEAGHVNFL